MGNNTSHPSSDPTTSTATSSNASKLHSSSKNAKRSRRLANGVIVSKRSSPTLTKITKLELKGELFKYGSNNSNLVSENWSDDMYNSSNNANNNDVSHQKERQKSVVSSQGSEATAQDVSIASTTSNSSLSSISSSSMVDMEDDNRFQHIEEIDKDIQYEHIEGVGLSGGDNTNVNPVKDADSKEKVDVVIKWTPTGNEKEVHIIGDFTNWKKKLKLHHSDNEFSIRLNLLKGLYKIQFLINNREMKISNRLPIATDNEGNIVNWFEVVDVPSLHEQEQSSSDAHIYSVKPPDYFGSAIEAGSMENKRLGKKALSLENLLTNVHLSSSAPASGMTTPSLESGPQSAQPPSQPPPRNFPYNTNQRHISNQSTISGYSQTNDSSSVNSVSTYHYKTPDVPQLQYTSDLPEIYFKDEYAYPYPPPSEMDSSSSYFEKINFDDYISDKLGLPTPPELPLYLDSLLINGGTANHGHHHHKNNKLNDLNVDKYTGVNYSGLDSIPNHVILKHLITTNIKNNVMMVTVINRYQGKYVYQALYSPVDI